MPTHPALAYKIGWAASDHHGCKFIRARIQKIYSQALQAQMNIGIIIPDRGDRPRFMENCMRMLHAQTLKPVFIALENDPPASDKCDITPRYRAGYEKCNAFSKVNRPLDVIALWENDDFYAPDYLETMVGHWLEEGKPDILGTNYTIYYHIKLRKYYQMTHFTRASAMNTLLKPGLKIEWPMDIEPFLDLWLWRQLKGPTVKPTKHISIGIKHGIGKTGGKSHVDRFDRYAPPRGTDDGDYSFLKSVMDPESFLFYTNYFPL